MCIRDRPEGYCRFYVNPAQPCTETPRGRDYFGGDLAGVQSRLNYLKSLGVTVIYFNPIFDAASNHAYDTQDYLRIDPFFGTNQEFAQLADVYKRQHTNIARPYVHFGDHAHWDGVCVCPA